VNVTNDESAILPVRIGTTIAIIATIVLGFTQPLLPSESEGVWWFGVGVIASVSGIIGLFFLHWRVGRMQTSHAQQK
jgi:Na+/melibiose symporter-like transporter